MALPLSQSANSAILAPMRLGSLILKSNLFLSPLAGYTNLPFRLVVREVGGVGLCTTDLVNARSLLEKNPKAFKLIETSPADSPLAVQLFGSVPEEMRDAAIFLESIGVHSIDINMGCPVKKVCKVGGGSAMMTELNKTAALVRGMVNAVKIPVTVKMRLGWDDDNLTAPDLARTLEDVGIAAIFVHGRTREQGFGGTVNLAGIRKVVEAVKTIPVIGNGDIITPQAAKKMFDETGCAGVSIGRGAFYDPWIFKRTLEYLATCSSRREEALINSAAEKNEPPHVGCYENSDALPPEPPFAERVRIMCRHLDLMVEVFGEDLGCRMFRKVAPWYAKRFGPCHEFNKQVVQISTQAGFHDVLENYIRWRQQFMDEHGELLPRFRQPPMVASFMRESEPASTRREHIPVPKGPVEVW
ncbi:MAG: tRNA-dihydrouridine synthase [Verrucomicrobiales bacterium]|nr:tRNA-dihydrouridine synthase [Verrucomicrobiales bacterium]